MRQLVMQMMTTLNGRLDHPEEWVPEIPGDLYAEIDRIYDSFDTVLVGRTTALEMAAYWPGAETDESEPAVARSMARKMNTYTKYVFTRSGEPPEWSNVELVGPDDDEAVVAFVEELKARPGGDIHLSGGAQLARTQGSGTLRTCQPSRRTPGSTAARRLAPRSQPPNSWGGSCSSSRSRSVSARSGPTWAAISSSAPPG
jgi:dihydrofolate reductase